MGSVDVQKNFNSIPMLGVVLEQVSSDPGSPVEGRVWCRTDLDVLKASLAGTIKTIATVDVIPAGLPPTGSAGGDLTGTYPNPTIGANKVLQTALARALIQNGYASGTAATTDVALRRLGTLANDAMPGVSTLGDISSNNLNNGAIDMNSFKINNVLDGTLAGDAVNLGQMQAALQGLDPKASVVAATTANITLSGTQTIDTIAVTAGQRVLVKDQSTPAQNGIYLCAAGAWTRTTDNDASGEFQGAYVFVEGGSTNSGTGWVCTVATPPTVGTTSIPWSKFTSAASITAGNGLTGTTTFDVNVDGVTLSIVGDVLGVKPLGIAGGSIANASIDLTTKVNGSLPIANGGTAGTSAATARNNLVVPTKMSGTSAALTAGVWTDFQHNLGAMANNIDFKISTSGEGVDLDYRDKVGSETTHIQIKTDIPGGRAAGYYTVWCMG